MLEERTVGPRPAVAQIQNLQEQVLIAAIAAHRQPLHLVLVGVGGEAQQFRDAAVDIAQRIREILLLLQRQAWSRPPRQRAPLKIARTVERQHRGLLKRRRVIGGRRVRQVMVQHHDPAVGKPFAQLQVEIGFGDGPRPPRRHPLFPARARQSQAGLDGAFGHLRATAPRRARTSFDSSTAATISPSRQDGAGGVAENTGNSEDDHRECSPRGWGARGRSARALTCPSRVSRSWPTCPAAPPCG